MIVEGNQHYEKYYGTCIYSVDFYAVQSEKVDSWLTGNEILKKLSDNDARNRKLLAVKDDQIKEIYQMLFAKDDQNREIY